MADIISLGKKENLGEIDLDKIKSGITKKDLGIEPETVLSSIFDRLDANGNKNGTLDRAEVNKFIEIVKKLCRKDNNLSEKEAGKFELDDADKKTASKEFLKFLSKMADLTKGVESVQKNDGYEVVTYSDGKVEEIYDDGSKLTRQKIGEETCETIYNSDGNEIRRTTIDKNNKITSDSNTTYDENGTPVSKSTLAKTVMHTSGENPKDIDGVYYTEYTYDKNKKEFVEDESTTIANDSASNTVIKSYRNNKGDSEDLEIQNGLYVRHSKTEGFETKSLHFDKQGCLLGYVVQAGETADSIAKKFGITKELLLRANPKSSFLVLDQIRIPKQVEIDDPAVQDMKSRSEVWENSPKVSTTWYDPETKEDWTEELVIVKDKLKHGWKVAVDKEGTQYVFTKNNKRLSDEEVQDQLYWDSLKKVKAKAGWGNPVVGIVKKGLTRGRMLVRTRDGAMYIMSRDNMLLDDQYAAETEYFDKHKKVKGRIKDRNGNIVTEDFVVLKDGLRNGRKIVMDSEGNRYLMAADGNIIDEKITAENDYKKDIAKDPQKAMKASLAIIKTMYNKAKAAFDKYLKQEGWTEKAADAISVLWGSENRAEVVKQKLDYYGHQIKELEYYLSKNDSNRFSGAFKEMFKVDFRPQSISDYVQNPTEHNYVNAFGVDNDIAHRVQKYIQSQGWSGGIVKAAGTAVGGIISAIAVPVSAPAGVSVAIGAIGAGAASLLIGLTDRASSDVGLQDGDIAKIAEQAAWDGGSMLAGGIVGKVSGILIKGASTAAAMGRAAVNVLGDTAVGAAQEYAESGEISVEGVLSNVIISSAGNLVSLKGHKTSGGHSSAEVVSRPDIDVPAAAEASYTGKVKGMNPALAEADNFAAEYHSSYKGRSSEALNTKPDTSAQSAELKAVQEKPKKSISEMNEKELFDEYSRISKETLASTDNKAKLSNIKQMKEIENRLKTKGYSIEQGRLSRTPKEVSNQNAAAKPDKTSAFSKTELKTKLGGKLFELHEKIESSIEQMQTIADFNRIKNVIAAKFKDFVDVMNELLTKLELKAKSIGLDIIDSAADRSARLGKRLNKYFTKIENAIDNMTDVKRFNKLLDKITTKFEGFADDMKYLLDKLYTKANSIGLSVKDSLEEVYARAGITSRSVSGNNLLDRYIVKHKKIDMSKTHGEWMKSRKDLFGENMHDFDCWSGYRPKDQHHGAWKMHLYSVDEADWREMCDVIIPYLKDHDIDWKTFNAASGADCLNGSKQQGKAFTIYPKNNDDMAKIAKDLDYIIRKNRLETSGSHITGDNQMGSTGRLFYRYEFNSVKYKDEIINLGSKEDFEKYYKRDKYGNQIGGFYDANRGEGQYLAKDMTPSDDIWRNFNPADPNARPSYLQIYRLNKKVRYEMRGYYKLRLANVEIDLNMPEYRSKINRMKEGERLTIGRNGNIKISDEHVSKIHVIIEKRNGKIYIIDNSSNGTGIIYDETFSAARSA